MTTDSVLIAQNKLHQGIQALLQSEKWGSFLRFSRAFHTYSWHNQLLIWAQNDQATHVAGFHTWKKLGRHVIRGEHGMFILAPLVSRTSKLESGKGHSEDRDVTKLSSPSGLDTLAQAKVLHGFRTVYVFDIAQTEGEPVPDLPVQVLTGTSEWYDRLRQVCPFPVLETDDLGGANGSYTVASGQIKILQPLDSLHKAKTLLHEWAHGLLHSDGEGRELSREVKELEAESTAFIVCDALGLDTAAYSFGYLASWNGDEAVQRLTKCGPRIARTVDAIWTTIRDHASDPVHVAAS